MLPVERISDSGAAVVHSSCVMGDSKETSIG